MSCTTFGVVLPAVGRAAPPEQRSMAMGLASAGGSVGQMLMMPLAQGVRIESGAAGALFALAVVMLLAAPLGIVLDRRAKRRHAQSMQRPPSLARCSARAIAASRLSAADARFLHLWLPARLHRDTSARTICSLCHMPVGLGATALGADRPVQHDGSWACGWLGGRFRQQYVLGWLYLIRALAIARVLPAAEKRERRW